MNIKKSRKFYQDHYLKAILQFGENSLTAIICKKKLALLEEKFKQLRLRSEKLKPSDNATAPHKDKSSL